MPNLLHIVWDIDPEIISSPISLRYYGLLFATAFISGYYVLQKIFENDKVKAEWLDSILMYVIIGTVAGARLGHCFLYDWEYFQHHLLEIFLPVRFEPEFEFIGYRGLASHGAAVGIIASAWLWSKRISKKPVLWILDRIVITVALGGFFIRMGNLMNSEIIGLPSDLPWAFVFKQLDEIPRHPTQLYEAFSYLTIFIILFFLHFKKKLYLETGKIFGTFLILLFGIRLILEQLKENQSAFEDAMLINMGQLLSIPFILAGIFLILRKVEKQQE
ncbi:MAG: prolipoprotein diacylglyceryl transferase [Crocinitomicaceae bacterium]|nr:prolipoprotein diacylglyceryl transferase [Crocinitomicaceae bacterium]|tara:strand:+ start:1220 stop:2041 length:822 start_codon:yes stop_codon:yes gene_type:complete